jgi:hypothetical protein
MLNGGQTDAAPSSTSLGQVFFQRNLVLDASPGLVFGANLSSTSIPSRGIAVRGAPSVRVQVFHYGVYNDGLVAWNPRPWIAWRVVGTIPSGTVTDVTNVVDTYTPITTAQTTSINNPVSIHIPSGGLQYVGIEFDITGGVANANQGYDRILVSISASG